MAKYIFAYHGGSMPETPEEGTKVMQAWTDWFQAMGVNVIDGGVPVGMSTKVNSDGSVTNDGGSNPISGYTLINASDMDDAVAKAKTAPC